MPIDTIMVPPLTPGIIFVKLTLAATEEIEVRSNVECEPGAEFEFKH